MSVFYNKKNSINMIISLILSIVIVICVSQQGFSAVALSNNNAKLNKQYLVEIKSEKTYNKIKTNYNEKFKRNLKKINKNKTYTMSLNESEANNLKKRYKDIIIEEDIIVSADSVEEEMLEDFFDEDSDNTELTESYPSNISMVKGTENDLGNDNCENIKIGVLDSGIAYNEEINVVERTCLIPDYREDNCRFFQDLSGHGTSIAGVIAAKQDGKGVIGICPNVGLFSIQVLDADNTSPISRIVNGINWAVQNDIDILNVSIGTNVNSQILHDAIINAYNSGMIIIASAGNTSGCTEYPAKYSEVISVGSVDGQGSVSSFSANDEYVDIYAPGEGVVTTGLLEGYSAVSGTSIAAPHVTAAAARILSIDDTKNGQFVKQLLKTSSNICYSDDTRQIRLLDIKNAIDIYDEFSSDSFDEIEPNEAEVEEYQDDAIAVGSWSKSKHAQLVENDSNASLISTKHLQLMATTAYMADEFYGVSYYDSNNIEHFNHEFYPLHANGYTSAWDSHALISHNSNFLADTKYLYRLARYYYDSPSTTYADTQSNINTVKKAGANYSVLQKIVFSEEGIYINPHITYTDSRGTVENVSVKGIIHMNVLNNYTEGDTTTRAFKILGLALHLAGDTYSHRTRVPLSSVQLGGCFYSNPDSFSFNTNHTQAYDDAKMKKYLKERNLFTNPNYFPCYCFDCFKQAVSTGHVEFRDVNKFTHDLNYEGEVIEYTPFKADKTSFYPKRYNIGSAHAVNMLISRFLNEQDFTVFVFLPNDTSYTLKLNCLRQYVDETGMNWDGLQPSTQERIIALSTGALV